MHEASVALRLRSLSFRYVTDADATTIIALRRAAEARGFLSPTGSAEQQRVWLKSYEDRFRDGSEHYFMICTHANGVIGTIRVYDVQAGHCEWGSWILRNGAPPNAALESYLLVNYFIFERLRLRRALVRVRKANRAVTAFHRAMRSTDIGESENEIMLEVDKEWYAALKHRYMRYFDPDIGSERCSHY